jgi:hypothetical protein
MSIFLEMLGPLGFIVTAGLLFPERYRKNYLVVGLACVLAAGSAWFTIEEFAKRAVLKQIESSSNPPAAAVLTADEVFWLSIKDSKVVALFEEFVRKFPSSPHVREASTEIDILMRTSSTAPEKRPSTTSARRCVIFNGREICE